VCQANQGMGDAVQARGWGEAGNVGCEIGKKKRKTSARPPHLTWVQASGSSTSENRVHSPSDRAGGGDERGAESCSLSLRLPLISEQTKLVCASAPVVSATTVSFASESKESWGRGS
jgi:hypothetical protein